MVCKGLAWMIVMADCIRCGNCNSSYKPEAVDNEAP